MENKTKYKMTELHRQHISKALKGRKKSNQHRQAIANAMAGNQNAAGHDSFQLTAGYYKDNLYKARAYRRSDSTWALYINFFYPLDPHRIIIADPIEGARKVTAERLEAVYQQVKDKLSKA